MAKRTASTASLAERESRRLTRLVVLGALVRGELSTANGLAALSATWEQVAS